MMLAGSNARFTAVSMSTFLVGVLPSYSSWGAAAPICLIALRLLQGLALGGEYGGAAVYVAEHAPSDRRGYYTSFIQTTATLGLLLSLVVVLLITGYVNGHYAPIPQMAADGTALLDAKGAPVTLDAFKSWGWRVPFILSFILLATSLYIRTQLSESPAFQKLKDEGNSSKAPMREAFGQWKNAKIALIALFGLTMGQAVVWYSGQFYALFFIQNVVKVDFFSANVFVAWSLILGTGGFLFFGGLSDRIGRKPIILAGCFLAAITYFPVFKALTATANPQLYAAQQTPVVVTADPASCSFQFNPVGTAKFTTSCDIIKASLGASASGYSVNSTTVDGPAGSIASIKVGETVIQAYDGPTAATAIKNATAALETAKTGTDQAATAAAQTALDAAKAIKPAFDKALKEALVAAGYPVPGAENLTVAKANGFFDIFTGQKITIILIMTYLIILVTMVYGPIAAMLVELFPTRIRYSGLSLPYHIGNGWFGGLLPATAFAISAQTGNIYSGLWYAIIVAGITVVIGTIFVPNGTQNKSIFAED